MISHGLVNKHYQVVANVVGSISEHINNSYGKLMPPNNKKEFINSFHGC